VISSSAVDALVYHAVISSSAVDGISVRWLMNEEEYVWPKQKQEEIQV
jgi:hypothetical protein